MSARTVRCVDPSHREAWHHPGSEHGAACAARAARGGAAAPLPLLALPPSPTREGDAAALRSVGLFAIALAARYEGDPLADRLYAANLTHPGVDDDADLVRDLRAVLDDVYFGDGGPAAVAEAGFRLRDLAPGDEVSEFGRSGGSVGRVASTGPEGGADPDPTVLVRYRSEEGEGESERALPRSSLVRLPAAGDR